MQSIQMPFVNQHITLTTAHPDLYQKPRTERAVSWSGEPGDNITRPPLPGPPAGTQYQGRRQLMAKSLSLRSGIMKARALDMYTAPDQRKRTALTEIQCDETGGVMFRQGCSQEERQQISRDKARKLSVEFELADEGSPSLNRTAIHRDTNAIGTIMSQGANILRRASSLSEHDSFEETNPSQANPKASKESRFSWNWAPPRNGTIHVGEENRLPNAGLARSVQWPGFSKQAFQSPRHQSFPNDPQMQQGILRTLPDLC